MRRLVLRSPYDREILGLAVPALGALAAEPLYVLVDTAIVGHLGTTQLAALAIAATVLSSAFTIFNFLTYGTTARVARLHGAGRDEEAAAARRAGAVAGGSAIGVVLAALRGRAGRAGGADWAPRARSSTRRVLYLRIAALGAPFFMLAAAGQGFLRGIGRPAHAAVDPRRRAQRQRRARAAVRLRLRLGDRGLGVGHGDRPGRDGRGVRVGAAARVRLGAAAARAHPLAAADRRRDRGAHDGAARRRSWSPRRCWRGSAPSSLGAHQIAFQLFVFLALVLDAIAIAGQVMVGRMLGAGDPDGARAAAVRMIGWSVAARLRVRARPARARRT